MIPNSSAEACLGLNFTSILGSEDPIPVEYLRKAAVKWYIVPKEKADIYTKKFNPFGIIKKYEDENRVVFYDEKAYPMVFNSSEENVESKNYKVTSNSIELTVNSQQPNEVIFNNIYNSFFEGFVDGKRTELKATDNIHFKISVPAGKHYILIRYKDPYFITGTYIAISVLIIIAVIYIVLKNNLFKSTVKNI